MNRGVEVTFEVAVACHRTVVTESAVEFDDETEVDVLHIAQAPTSHGGRRLPDRRRKTMGPFDFRQVSVLENRTRAVPYITENALDEPSVRDPWPTAQRREQAVCGGSASLHRICQAGDDARRRRRIDDIEHGLLDTQARGTRMPEHPVVQPRPVVDDHTLASGHPALSVYDDVHRLGRRHVAVEYRR